MEATGVYHESLAYYLTDNNSEASIVLPNKISNFFRTLDVNTITDKTASKLLPGLDWKGNWKYGKNLKEYLGN